MDTERRVTGQAGWVPSRGATEPSVSELRDHLAEQLRRAYRGLVRAIDGLSESQAGEGARSDWRRYRWGSGLDGSIAGIVRHVALWKQNLARGLETGTFPAEESLTPPAAGWEALQEWLTDGQERLERAMERCSRAELAEAREWEGMTAPVSRLLSYLIEHDFYHTGQIELLRQLGGYPTGAD
jgi:uncharacterized damage-inducible protein DinB